MKTTMFWKNATIIPVLQSYMEYKEYVKSFDEYTSSNFYDLYATKYQKVWELVESAKIYIVENWQKIEDWSELEFILDCVNHPHAIEFYNYDKHDHSIFTSDDSDVNKIYKNVNDRLKKKHNPVKSIDNVILDPTNGDFSITVNGTDYNWIGEEPIIEMAHYIELKLNEK